MGERVYRYNLLANFAQEDVDRFVLATLNRRRRPLALLMAFSNILETVVLETETDQARSHPHKEVGRSTEDIPPFVVTLRPYGIRTPTPALGPNGHIGGLKGVEAAYSDLSLPKSVGITVPTAHAIKPQEGVDLPQLRIPLGGTKVPPHIPF